MHPNEISHQGDSGGVSNVVAPTPPSQIRAQGRGGSAVETLVKKQNVPSSQVVQKNGDDTPQNERAATSHLFSEGVARLEDDGREKEEVKQLLENPDQSKKQTKRNKHTKKQKTGEEHRRTPISSDGICSHRYHARFKLRLTYKYLLDN